MKCLTIRQPWATLVALGEKKLETRTRATKYRGKLAIHAGLRVDREICGREPFRSVLASHGFTADNLPLGAIVGVCELTDCYAVTAGLTEAGWPGGNEVHFGDYREGRYAWQLEAAVMLPKPIAAAGKLGFWEYPVEEQGFV